MKFYAVRKIIAWEQTCITVAKIEQVRIQLVREFGHKNFHN